MGSGLQGCSMWVDRLRVGLLNGVTSITPRLGDHTLVGPLWEGYQESRRCSRYTYPESDITEYANIRRLLTCQVVFGV